MKFVLDQHAHLNSPIHRWDPRFKLIGFILLIFAFSFVSHLYLLPAMAAVTITIFAISRIPISFILARLRYPSFFLFIVVIMLPFISGSDVLFNIGILDVNKEGCEAALLISVRFFCILTLGLILFSTAPLIISIKAMRSLGLPSILADMTLLTFRYLFEIGNYLHQMETALRLRGFKARRFSRRGFNTLAWLGGSILVRTYERSEWIYKAMIIRGYGRDTKMAQVGFQAATRDILALGLLVLLATGFVVVQVLT
ncbi:MAG: cobalt ECF transporter T component CbiQ [Chloroflexi bacterium]|nr:cobalt ECF transporter T component CbiQ [Chloroflexota bacterium]